MTQTMESFSVILFGAASVLAALIGAFNAKGWRIPVLLLLAVLLLAVTLGWLSWPVVWIKGPVLSPFMTALWDSRALVVLVPVLIISLMKRAPAEPAPAPDAVTPENPFPHGFAGRPRPKPRVRNRRGEAG